MPGIASPTAASGIRPARSLPLGCTIWRSFARITSGRRPHLPPDEARLRVSIRRPGLGESAGAVMAAVQYTDHGLFQRGGLGGDHPVRHTGHLQY